MPNKVFISHSSTDKHVADAICAYLEGDGVRCWVAPRDLQPGASYGSEILRGIDDSRVMVVVLSTHANGSRHVCKEVERAISKGLTVIPFRIEDIMPSKDLEFFLSAEHWLDAITPPLEMHLTLLLRSVQSYLGAIEQHGRAETAAERREAERVFEEMAPDDWSVGSRPSWLARWVRAIFAEK